MGLKVASRLPSDDINTLGWSILAFLMLAMLGVNGIKLIANATNSANPSAPNAANPFVTEIVLSRLLNRESIAVLK
jgi:hypothetical protein